MKGLIDLKIDSDEWASYVRHAQGCNCCIRAYKQGQRCDTGAALHENYWNYVLKAARASR